MQVNLKLFSEERQGAFKRAGAFMRINMLTTVNILKIGTPEIITIIVLQLEQLDFTVWYCVQKMQTE